MPELAFDAPTRQRYLAVVEEERHKLEAMIGGRVKIAVTDSGPGMPPEHLPHVFDRFYKADAAPAGTRIASGSGLGLSIVQAIVSRHGGEVIASNAPEGGARFEMWLPATA